MPINPEWWDSTTGPFRDNSNGEISAATLRQFSQHLSTEGVPSGWIQFVPGPVALPDALTPDPAEDRGLLQFSPEEGTAAAAGAVTQQEGAPGVFQIPDIGYVSVVVDMRGLITLTNFPEGDTVVPVFVLAGDATGIQLHAVGRPVTVDATGGAYVGASRRFVFDTAGGVVLLVGVGLLPLGDWGDPSNGDEVEFTNPDDPFDTNFTISALISPASAPS